MLLSRRIAAMCRHPLGRPSLGLAKHRTGTSDGAEDPADTREEPARVLLEALILNHVDDGVDAAVAEDGDNGEVVEDGAEVYGVAEGKNQVVDLVARPAGDETEAHGGQGLDDVVLGAAHLATWRNGGGRLDFFVKLLLSFFFR